MQEKKTYVTPEIEIVEFVSEDSIANSAEGAWLNEDIWG